MNRTGLPHPLDYSISLPGHGIRPSSRKARKLMTWLIFQRWKAAKAAKEQETLEGGE